MKPTNTSLLQEILQFALPGRRRLRRRQRELLMRDFGALQKLIHEYRNLSELPTRSGPTTSLGSFDHEAFKRFLRSQRCVDSWDTRRPEDAETALPEMAGGVNRGDQRLIFHLIEFLAPNRVLEVGTHIGASTIHIAKALTTLESDDRLCRTIDIRDVNCTATEPWKEFGAQSSPAQLLSQAGCLSKVDFVCRPSIEFLEQHSERYDVIFLDGDHSAQIVYQEVPLALDRLKPEGLILLHDYFPALEPLWADVSAGAIRPPEVIPGVFLAIQRLLREGTRFAVTPLGALPWATKLGSNVTSLAILHKES